LRDSIFSEIRYTAGITINLTYQAFMLIKSGKSVKIEVIKFYNIKNHKTSLQRQIQGSDQNADL